LFMNLTSQIAKTGSAPRKWTSFCMCQQGSRSRMVLNVVIIEEA